MKELEKSLPFLFGEIEDVRVIIIAKGKHYSMVPKKDFAGNEAAKQARIAILSLLLDFHQIVTPSLEEIRDEKIQS